MDKIYKNKSSSTVCEWQPCRPLRWRQFGHLLVAYFLLVLLVTSAGAQTCTVTSPPDNQTFLLPHYSGQATTTHTQAFQLQLFELDAVPVLTDCTKLITAFSDYTFDVKANSEASYQTWETVKLIAPYN